MKKYRVYGSTTVTVAKEVWANNEDQAYEKAFDKLSSLTEYCGNGGYDKLVGVDGYNESVNVPDIIEYDDCEVLEDDLDYFECPECGESCEEKSDIDGTKYWWCEDCNTAYDEDGYEYYPEEEDE